MQKKYVPFTEDMIPLLLAKGFTDLAVLDEMPLEPESVVGANGAAYYNDVLFIQVIPLTKQEAVEDDLDHLSLSSRRKIKSLLNDVAFYYQIDESFIK